MHPSMHIPGFKARTAAQVLAAEQRLAFELASSPAPKVRPPKAKSAARAKAQGPRVAVVDRMKARQP